MARTLTPAQRMERSILTDFRKTLWKPFIAAVKRYELIAPGDKIAVCISGGKDSMLMAKLLQLKAQENKEKIEDIKGEQKDIAWGSQIRSYVFHPSNLVKDHRTGCETGNVVAVMDGDLDNFINEYLKASSKGEI